MAQYAERRQQRIRDPVHGLIVFSMTDNFERLMWSLLNASEFQRLRRIKQLGFSELVYPGATHTRFSHSVGVFHTSRELVRVLKRLLGSTFCEEKANVAMCSALLHDLGHGPFSHAFEGVEKIRKVRKKHEKWTVEIIRGDTQVGHILSSHDECFQVKVANLLEQEYPVDIYSSIVSSQFDADRIDYLQRDRIMTGTEYAGLDWDWLLNNLEIEKLTIGGDDEKDPFEVEGFILGAKGLKAAESYLVGRFHMYTQVYMHKATRAAEKMLGSVLTRAANLLNSGDPSKTGLPKNHPLRLYFGENGNTMEHYLRLDDATIWDGLTLMERARDKEISELAGRLRNRSLYKCIDIGSRHKIVGGDARGKFQKKLSDAKKDGHFGDIDVLEDRATVSAYRFRSYESPDALSKITIRLPDGTGRHEDVARVSPVIQALEEDKVFRVYGRNGEVKAKLDQMWREATG